MSSNEKSTDAKKDGKGELDNSGQPRSPIVPPKDVDVSVDMETLKIDDKKGKENEKADKKGETTGPKDTDDNAIRAAKLKALKKKSEASKAKFSENSTRKIELFDSTTASEWKTAGTHTLGLVKKDDNSIIISGRNIGAEQREPDWSKEQLEVIDRAKSTMLPIRPVNNTRKSVMDPLMEYVGRDDTGSIVPTELAYVSTLDTNQYCIGMGPDKYDTTGSPRYYSDVVIADINGQWLVNQWTSEGIILEGVASNVLMQQNRPGNTSGRRLGYHFARIGLPAYAFGPLFNTLSAKFDGCLSQVTMTRGYYWMNASWGVSSYPGVFSYMSETGMKKITALSDVMRLLDGKSSLCLGTIAVSITCSAKTVDGKPTPDKSSFGLSVKMHNAFNIDVVDYHGPPQQGSTGMTVPARIAQKAKVMNAGRAGLGGSSIFSTQNTNIFTQTPAEIAPITKNTTTKGYM